MISISKSLKMVLEHSFGAVVAEQFGGDGRGDVTITFDNKYGEYFTIGGNAQVVSDLAEFFTTLDKEIKEAQNG